MRRHWRHSRIILRSIDYRSASDLDIDERVLEECSEGHDVGALLISASRNDLPEPLEKRKQTMKDEKRAEQNRDLHDF